MSTGPLPPSSDGRPRPLLRQGVPGEKKPLLEKILTYYDQLFQGDDPSVSRPQFWEEFFLLKVNVEYLSNRLDGLEAQQLLSLKKVLNQLFIQACRTLQADDNMIRNINALQTLCVLLNCVFRRRLSESSFDVIDIVIGFDSAETQMRNLVESLSKFLVEEYPGSLKNLSLRLLLIVVTATHNVSQNTLLEYLMMNSVFEAIMQVLSSPVWREAHGYDATVVLTLLVNYRKYEAANPYVIKLSVLDDEIALNGLGCVISTVLSEYNRQYVLSQDPEPVGIFGAITSYVSNMLVPSELPRQPLQISEGVLLSLYEAVHLNRNFITVLTHTRSGSQPTTPTLPAPAVHKSLQVPSSPGLEAYSNQPTNLLGTFLTFSSIVLQNTKDEVSVCHGRLCLVILTCIAEDQYANAFLHDPNMTFPVILHKASLLHRKVRRDKTVVSVPLACSLLDLVVEFVISHLSKNFKEDLYKRSLGLVHRVLCYQKRCKIRLAYNWKQLWRALVNILKFFVASEEVLLPRCDVFAVSDEVVRIFNLFITYGDTFLPNPTTYDELYYELIRVHKVFDDLHSIVLRHVTDGGAHMTSGLLESGNRLLGNLVNVRSIAAHFTPKIDAWSLSHDIGSISPDQVLEVVRANYDTLTLKLQDNLDYFDKYAEKARETSFFTQLVRSVVDDVRQSITVSSLQQTSLLNELALTS
ncbi:armadillo-like helical domain-containing protein 3 [Halichondria panicea]|uniref:armadillo-like helical domain-containing protein 3 n=1 Tax=Halichondria panicea TaxID=6063 RepID=UPI00312B6100